MNIENILQQFDDKFALEDWPDVKAFLVSSIETAFNETAVKRETVPLQLKRGNESAVSFWEGRNSALEQVKKSQLKFMGKE